MKSRPNLVITIFDTARRDRFGCYGYVRGTTPAVDGFADEALVFDRMISPAPWTVPSHASLFTGLYPREHGADHPVPMLRPPVLTLAGHLGALGYSTVCVTNNSLLHGQTGLADGFATLVMRPATAGRNGWMSRATLMLGVRDSGAAATNRAIAAMLDQLPRPFFLFVNYLECHWHYMPPRRYERRYVRGYPWWRSVWSRLRSRDQVMWEAIALADRTQIQRYNDLYDAELAYLDSRFGDLLEQFQRTRLLTDTVFIVTSDHGENIGEQGLASHAGTLRQNVIHVPFIVRAPGRSPARIGGLVQFTDLFAGLCRLLGLPVPPLLEDRPFGVDPFVLQPDEAGREFAFAEWTHWGPAKVASLQQKAPHFDFGRIPEGLLAVQDHRFKLVIDVGTGRESLYDLATDSLESGDLRATHSTDAARLRAALGQWQSALPERAQGSYSSEEQELVEGRLRDLGYI